MSNAQSWSEVFAPVEARNRSIVQQDTWGHLAPVKNISYKCRILFSVSGYSTGTTLIDSSFEGLEDSPWLYEAMNEMIQSDQDREYGVYLFEGNFKNYKWKGDTKLLYSIPQY